MQKRGRLKYGIQAYLCKKSRMLSAFPLFLCDRSVVMLENFLSFPEK